MPEDRIKEDDKVKELQKRLGSEFNERVKKLLPIAREFVANREPEDVFEYVASMDPKDAYILGLIIGRL
jgi:hypothetical protein